ncbi:38239_t:CDS:2, partial [Gigaspora margarita]
INKPPKELEFIPTVSFFKHLSILLSNGGQHEIQKLIRESDPNKIGLHFTFDWTIYITDIEYAISFLSENVHTIPKLEFPPSGPFNIAHWSQQRKIASSAFNQILRLDMVGGCTNEFIKLLNKWTDTPIDVYSFVKRLTFQIFGKLAFTYDMKELDSLKEDSYIFNIFNKIFQHANNPLFMIFPFLNSLPLKRNFEFSSLVKEFDDFIFKIIEQRRLEMSKEKNKNEYNDLLAGILEAANHEENYYTNKEIRDNLISYLDIQKKAREEVINVLGSASNLPTSENLKDLKYLTAIIMESLRLYPPAAILIPRKPTKPLNLSKNIILPKERMVVVNFWQIHRNPDIWTDPDKFIPERFINPTKEIRNSWIPFSIGSRSCVGQNFAIKEQKVVIALTLLNFEIKLPPNIQHLDEIPLKKNQFTYS